MLPYTLYVGLCACKYFTEPWVVEELGRGCIPLLRSTQILVDDHLSQCVGIVRQGPSKSIAQMKYISDCHE